MSGRGAVLVTGGSRGIGAATSRLLAARGHAVCINYVREEEPARALVTEITQQGGAALAVRADVSSEADVLRLFEAASTLGPLAGLVNNAAILERQMRLDAMDVERVQRVMAVNVVGALLCCREAVRRMSRRHGGAGGAIVNVSSMAAKYGSPNEYIDYAASKGAVDSMTIGLARETAEEGVRVNGVRPGPIHTEIHARGGEPGRIDRIKGNIPMKRGGEPHEVAAAICWLLSEEASYITGTFIDVAGGR